MDSGASSGVRIQTLTHQVNRGLRRFGSRGILPNDFSIYSVFRCKKWRGASEKIGKKDAQSPHFGGGGLVRLLEQNLCGCIPGSSEESIVVRTRLVWVNHHGTPEVDQFYL